MRVERPLLHILAADVPFDGHRVGAGELGDLGVAETLAPALGFCCGRGESELLSGDHGLRDGDCAHVLHATADDNVLGAAHHALGGEMDCLLR